ncbi:MAG: T9SS type A sorting domain-containing protein [Bacteroidota bacterium]|nr:T9SS type A sorting domain-containing protein [Bacteroidota bacterium]
MKKKFLLSLLALYFFLSAQSQCSLPSANGDSLMPVTNRYNTSYSRDAHIVYNTGSEIINIAADKGKYYLLGSFRYMSPNQGPGLVIDTSNNTVRTTPHWRINGTVLTALPNGKGGFYIGGDFTRIGDSIRTYMAEIDNNGQPTSWNPKANGIVRTMQNRNDTLFIGGDFSTFLGQTHIAFEVFSIKGDSSLPTAVTAASSISSFLLKGDTIIYAGQVAGAIRKYDMRRNFPIGPAIAFTEYGNASLLQFNGDSSVIIYASDYNGQTLLAFSATTGAFRYAIGPSMNATDGYSSGTVLSLKVCGNKAYAAGYFEAVEQGSTGYARRGFCSFDASTGAISGDNLNLGEYPTFLDIHDGRIFLSGNFTFINGVNRLNFAVVDTGSLNVEPWQLSPSDEMTSIAFSNGTAFIGGHFNGIQALPRNGFAAIDSATRAVLPWNPANPGFTEGKRMMIQGDTLFILGITARPSQCAVDDFNASFQMYRLSDGLQLPVPDMHYSRMVDFIIDSGYLYASVDNELRRYSIPSLTRDPSWGYSFAAYGPDHSPIYLVTQGDKIYSIGDNRFDQQCTTLPQRKGWLVVYDKASGAPLNFYSYQGNNSYYDQITFDHALLSNNRLYIQGYFNSLNGKPRRNFACIDVTTGQLTDWQTTFSQTATGGSFLPTSDLKLFNGKIWFGSPQFPDITRGRFPGFGAIDTATGALMPALFDLGYVTAGYTEFGKTGSVEDFIFTDKSLLTVGGFDYVNGQPFSNLAVLPLQSSPNPALTPDSICGPDTIYTNNRFNQYTVIPANTGAFTYSWTYSGKGVTLSSTSRVDSVLLSADTTATGGNLVVKAVGYCEEGQVAQKTIIVAAPPPPLPVPVATGIADRCVNDDNGVGKLMNPPENPLISVSVTQDGLPLNYNQSDSSFQYFNKQQINYGRHAITVKYKYTYATRDSTDSIYQCTVSPLPQVNIIGNTVMNAGQSTSLSALPSIGNHRSFQWQDSTASHGWQDIAGATPQVFNYTPNATGDKIRCLLTADTVCLSPVTIPSNALTFTVHIVTAVNTVTPAPAGIHVYPNPAFTSIRIDSLQFSDKWQSAEIVSANGQRTLAVYSILARTSIDIPISRLSSGYYLLILRRQNGTAVYRSFVKL